MAEPDRLQTVCLLVCTKKGLSYFQCYCCNLQTDYLANRIVLKEDKDDSHFIYYFPCLYRAEATLSGGLDKRGALW